MNKIYSLSIRATISIILIVLTLTWAPVPEPFPMILSILACIYLQPIKIEELTDEEYEKRRIGR